MKGPKKVIMLTFLSSGRAASPLGPQESHRRYFLIIEEAFGEPLRGFGESHRNDFLVIGAFGEAPEGSKKVIVMSFLSSWEPSGKLHVTERKSW
jgi:hypothetical protein